MIYDLICIGAGPAGCSAALYAARGGAQVLVLDSGSSSLKRAGLIQNYYGLPAPTEGPQLYQQGLQQLKQLQIKVRTAPVLDIAYDNGFTVTTAAQKLQARSLVIAAGAARRSLPLPGIARLEGKGVSYCAVCDGFFFRKKKVAVLGSGDFALHEAAVLEPLADQVTLLTNGEPAPAGCPYPLRTEKIAALEGDAALSSIRFEDGSSLQMDGCFIALGTADTGALARKMGLLLENNYLTVNQDMQTNMPGVFAAGDCIGGLNQVATAVSEGAVAGLSVIKYLRSHPAAAK